MDSREELHSRNATTPERVYGSHRVPFLELGGPIEEARTTLVIVSMKVVVLTSLVFSLMSSSA